MAKQDRHLTTARLSALIDGQLSAEEQAQSEEHLRTCELCQQQLAELRQMVALLQALPQPKLPRSFTLPVAEPALASRADNHSVRPLAPVTPLRPSRGMPTYISGAIRVVSTLAAVIGIIFLLSGLFGTVIVLPRSGSSNSGSASRGATTGSTPSKAVVPHVVTPHSTVIAGQDATPSPTNAPAVTSPDPTSNHPTQPNQPQPLLAFFDLQMPVSRAIIGVVLVVLGIIGFVLLRQRV